MRSLPWGRRRAEPSAQLAVARDDGRGAAPVWLLRVPVKANSPGGQARLSAAQRLGYDADARVLIINGDDFGSCEEANAAIIEAFRRGAVSSASVMVPAPGFVGAAEFARTNPHADIGVHLVLTSEWERGNRWGPVLGRRVVPSLVGADGCLWPNAAAVFARADASEAEAELRAQMNLALASGIDVSHIDSHMFVLHGRHAAYRDIYLRLGRDYRLPLRAVTRALLMPLAWRSALSGYSIPLRAARRLLLLRAGFSGLGGGAHRDAMLTPDYLVVMGAAGAHEIGACWRAVLERLPAGLTEIYCHPAFASTELCGYATDARERAADFEFFGSRATRALLAAADVRLIGYRRLRDAMRAGVDG